jgi:transcriptional regulator with XRE-family HTH domain
MKKFEDVFNELFEQDEELKKEVDLLEFKYQLISQLIAYRKENGISQTEFAKSIGVKQQMISRFEKGEVDPRVSFISKVMHGMKKKVIFRDTDFVKTGNIVYFNRKATNSNFNFVLKSDTEPSTAS